jgi:fructose-1,6-bisphosphatase I
MQDIFEAIKKSAKSIQKAIIQEDAGYSQNQNSSGEDQLKLDILSDQIIEAEFKNVASIHTISSEEKEDFQLLNPEGIYTVCYDPLDGSSLIDVNLSVGSIFGIYKQEPKGENIVGACYVVYGPRVELVYSDIFTQKVELFRLHNDHFIKIKEIKMAEKGTINASGATQKNWPQFHRTMIESMFDQGYTLRYSGGMVPDLHQILLKGGGLFSYPATSDKPEGKLRMLFEVFPFAFIFQSAGGAATQGTQSVLSLTPKHAHDTTPCYFGSKYEIQKVKQAHGH